MLINARSIFNKLDELKALLREESVDLIGITESWARDEMLDKEIILEDYNIFRKDRLERRGGGILLYVRKGIMCEVIKQNSEIESLWCKICSRNSSINLG